MMRSLHVNTHVHAQCTHETCMHPLQLTTDAMVQLASYNLFRIASASFSASLVLA